MIIAMRALLDEIEAKNRALTQCGAALHQLAGDMESGAVPHREAAILIRLLAEEMAYAASPIMTRPMPTLSTGP